MEDIISQGEHRRPPSRLRRLAVAAALVAVAALVVIEHLPPSGRPARPPHAHHVRIAGGVGERSFPVRLRVEGPATLPSGLAGPTVIWAGNERLPLTGSRPAWFWPAKGRIRPITGLPGDRYGYAFTRVGGGWAVLPDEVGSASFGPAVPVFYLPNGSGTADMIGVADQVASAATSHALWLTNYPPHANLTEAIGVAQEFTTNGLSVGRPVLLPAGYELMRGTKRGLLLQAVASGPKGWVRLWNPASARFTATFTSMVAASADAVAYTSPNCVSACPVHVLNLATGYKLTVRVPRGYSVTAAAFSPDGQYLALQVIFGDGVHSEALAVRLEVASLANGRLMVVPHTWTGAGALTGFGWPGNDDDLVAKLKLGPGVRMAFWAPGARSFPIASVEGGQNPADIVVGG